MKKNYYLRGNRWTKKKGKRKPSVLTTNLPLVSVFIIEENGIVSRGVALCSDSDNPEKYIGRWLAHINAVEARDSKKSSKMILRSEAVNVMDRVMYSSEFMEKRETHCITHGFGYRSEHNAILIPHEKKLLGTARIRENNKHPVADVETAWDTGKADPIGDIKRAMRIMGKTGIKL